MKRLYLGDHADEPLRRFDLSDQIIEQAKLARVQVEENQQRGWETTVDIPLPKSAIASNDHRETVDTSEDQEQSYYKVQIRADYQDPKEVRAELGSYNEMGFDSPTDAILLDVLDISDVFFGEVFLRFMQRGNPGDLVHPDDRELFQQEKENFARINLEQETRTSGKERL